MATTEERVAREQAEHDAAEAKGRGEDEAAHELEGAEGAIARDVEQAGLFDGNVYDDPKLELNHNGRRVTTIRVGFLGGFELGRHNVGDVDWFKSLREGQSFELIASGTVTGTVHTLRATEKHGTQLIELRKLSIDSVTESDGSSYGGTNLDEELGNLEAHNGELQSAIARALSELGVPGDGTPPPVANAVEILREAIGGGDEEDVEPITPEEQAQLQEAAGELEREVAASLGDIDDDAGPSGPEVDPEAVEG